MPKKPSRDRHALGVSREIVKTYEPKRGARPKQKGWQKPQPPGKPARTVLVKQMRAKKKP